MPPGVPVLPTGAKRSERSSSSKRNKIARRPSFPLPKEINLSHDVTDNGVGRSVFSVLGNRARNMHARVRLDSSLTIRQTQTISTFGLLGDSGRRDYSIHMGLFVLPNVSYHQTIFAQ